MIQKYFIMLCYYSVSKYCNTPIINGLIVDLCCKFECIEDEMISIERSTPRKETKRRPQEAHFALP